jgi:hypothetical protein
MLNMYLIDQYSKGKKVLLIVDEAQNLSTKVLEEIRLLSGIETHKEKVLRIILAGQPELKETLDSPNLKQLVQRVRLRFHVGPLDKRETREYIAHRLSVAGRMDPTLFSEEAYELIYRYTGGVPRLINTLCDTALLCAFADEKAVVDAGEMVAAVEDLSWAEHEQNTGKFRELQQPVPVPDRSHITRIEVRSKGKLLSEHVFGPGRIIVGRSPDNEIAITSKFVSRHHAQLTFDETGCTIEDLNSTNGVYVDEKRVKKVRLRNGDSVSLGIHDLVYFDLRDSSDEKSIAHSKSGANAGANPKRENQA